MEYLFGGIMAAGLLYLLLMIVGLADNLQVIDVDGIFNLADTDPDGFGCSIAAVFMAVFGALGVTGTLMGWNPLGTLFTAILVGVIIARLSMTVLRLVYRQQSAPIEFSDTDLIGKVARVTIASAPGATGEALVEADTLLKYPVREIDGAPLERGDQVTILDVEGRYLRVRKMS